MSKIYLVLGAALLFSLTFFMNDSPMKTSQVGVEQFQLFTKQFGKVYKNQQELLIRQRIFLQNFQAMIKHNKNPESTYEMGINQFSDLTKEEFIDLYLMKDIEIEEAPVDTENYTILGDTDWRSKGAVNSMKNQGSCGSCWAFAAVSSIESYGKIKKGSLGNYAEQQLVDCSKNGNMGCRGGYPNRAMQYVQQNGITTQSAYPYTARDGQCKTQGGAFKIGGVRSAGASDAGLKSSIDQIPVAVTVDASNWQSYKSGVFANCGANINHAVTAVGYTSAFWIIRNSWGTGWGQGGYMQLKMGNTCGLHRQAGCLPA